MAGCCSVPGSGGGVAGGADRDGWGEDGGDSRSCAADEKGQWSPMSGLLRSGLPWAVAGIPVFPPSP